MNNPKDRTLMQGMMRCIAVSAALTTSRAGFLHLVKAFDKDPEIGRFLVVPLHAIEVTLGMITDRIKEYEKEIQNERN